MTGKGGLVRQLSDMEIAAQAALARRLRPETKKVVFMGMGEPSHNLDNVLRAVEFLALYGGFGHKDLVISTVGMNGYLRRSIECLLVRHSPFRSIPPMMRSAERFCPAEQK